MTCPVIFSLKSISPKYYNSVIQNISLNSHAIQRNPSVKQLVDELAGYIHTCEL